jgi:hypothetical protein
MSRSNASAVVTVRIPMDAYLVLEKLAGELTLAALQQNRNERHTVSGLVAKAAIKFANAKAAPVEEQQQ